MSHLTCSKKFFILHLLLTLVCITFFLVSTAGTVLAAGPELNFRGARGFALIIGGWYEDGKPHGRWYWDVTRTFYEVLRNRYGYWDKDIYFLVHKDRHNDHRVDGFSTRASIKNAINKIANKAKPQDVVGFFFVGHGGPDHFAASDAAFYRTELNNWSAGIKSRHQLWTFSPCNSGNFPVTCASAGRTVFSSCRADEGNSMPWAEAVRDAFNYASGADEDNNGFISFAEAHNFARRRQIKHYGSVSKLKEHSQFCDCGCGRPTTGALPVGHHGRTAAKEILGHEFGQIQLWSGTARDGQRFIYPHRFTGKAVIVCSAQRNGKPIAACAVNNTDRDFVLSLHDKAGSRVTNAKALWVAYLPNSNRYIQANCQWIKKSNVRIRFRKDFRKLPVIVCNAQRKGGALLAGVTRFDKNSFDVQVTDLAGRPVNGSWMLWIAAEPYLQRPSLEISGGFMGNYPRSGTRKIWDPTSVRSDVILASAAWEDRGLRVLVHPCSSKELELKVMRPPGNYGASAWYTHYLSFRLKPPITAGIITTIRGRKTH